LRELHESQLLAYEQAARKALTEQAQSVSLPAVSEETEEETYTSNIFENIEKPEWKVNETVWEQAWEVPLRERARAILSENDNDETDEDDDEGEEEEEKPKVTEKVTGKKRIIATKAGKGLLKKKALSATTGTAGQRAIRGRRARRGGRGGGNASAAK
jgi:hypothetical protein